MFARTWMVMLGMAGAFALGLAVGPQIDAHRQTEATPVPVTAPEQTAVALVSGETAPVPVRLERVPPASAPAVQRHVQLLLSEGTDVKLAASGFPNARELMTVAHAARNTDIPFVLLKHRVLNERMPLARAINVSRPDLDEAAEVNRARAEARADLARMTS